MFSSGGGMGGSSPLLQLLSGLFGDSGSPFGAGMDQLQKYFRGAQGFQNPFFQAGTGAIPQYQDWLKGMSDPSGFINKQMANYQQSPYNTFLQQQAMRAGQNAASAQGTGGSTPFAQQMQQNASNIAQGGMNDWLQNVLGVNSQYGSGLNNLMGYGQHSADMLTNLFSGMGRDMASGATARGQAQNFDFNNMLSGILGLFGL